MVGAESRVLLEFRKGQKFSDVAGKEEGQSRKIPQEPGLVCRARNEGEGSERNSWRKRKEEIQQESKPFSHSPRGLKREGHGSRESLWAAKMVPAFPTVNSKYYLDQRVRLSRQGVSKGLLGDIQARHVMA